MRYLLIRTFIFFLPSGITRTKWIVKFKIFKQTGKNFYFCPRKLPADPKLIKFHDNVSVATDVMFINHDVYQKVYNYIHDGKLPKFYGCIEVGNNVFIGARVTILPNVKICDNVFIAAGTIVTRSITTPGIYGGCPARLLGDLDKFYEARKEYKANIFQIDKGVFYENLWHEFDERY